MPDYSDARLRGLIIAILDEAPEPCAFDELHAPIAAPSRRRRHRRTGAMLVGAGVILAAVVATVAFALLSDHGDAVRVSPGTRSASACFVDPGPHVRSDGARFGPSISSPAGGSVDLSAQPDYISVACPRDSGIAGYAKKSELFAHPPPAQLKVYNDGATAVVGHFISGKGFVPLKETPPSNGRVVIPLSQIPEGVSTRTINTTPVFMVRQGRSVGTYLTDAHGTPGLHVLWWCPKEKVFIEPAHAEAFDVDGRIVGGPAMRGLDRLRTMVDRGTVTVALREVVRGSTARYDRDPRARAEPGSYDLPGIYATPWNSGPQSFCYQALVGGQR
jgi:hypothetical protein